MTISQTIIDAFVTRGFKLETLRLSTDLKDDLCMDSLDIVELIMEIEKKYKINFDEHVSEAIKTIGDLIKLTEKCLMAENLH